jgi:hypothetical protein
MWISATSAGMTVFMHPRVSLNILMLSLSKYEVVVLVLLQAQDEGSVCRRTIDQARAWRCFEMNRLLC